MIYLLLACQITLAVILLLAATGKILNSEQFLPALRLSGVPKVLVTPIAILTPALEMCLAFGLVLSSPQLLPLTMAATAGLFGIFTVWMVSIYAHGLRVKCGCFGIANSDIGPHSILRNGILITVSLGGFILALNTQSLLPTPSLWLVITILSSGMCLMLLRAFQGGRFALILSMTKLQEVQERTEANPEL